MQILLAAVTLLYVTASLPAAEPPLVEKYLHAGTLAQGEQDLLLALERNPKDDQARFGLGVLQFVRAVERLGQALHEYGLRSGKSSMPFLRLPVPENTQPATISYREFGRVLDVFIADLDRAEKTLAAVQDDKVKLPLRLAAVRLDLTASGKPTSQLLDILVNLNGGRFEFLKGNEEFLVCFDRGDVAWLRAYCHLLSAIVDVYRAVNVEAEFDRRMKEVFPRIEAGGKDGGLDQGVLVIADGPRLGRFRQHMLAICALNHETWKFIRAETDDDHEWLPNARQKGVIGLPVTDRMIDSWLAMVDQVEGLLNGERLLPNVLVQFVDPNAQGKGLNLKTLLDDPPQSLSEKKIREQGIDAKYLEPEGQKKPFDVNAIFAVLRLFDGPLGVAYMAWFN